MSGWMVVRVRPQLLGRAVANMENQECECYSPRALVRAPRTRVLRAQPLFPGYVFARHPRGQWVFLRGTLGVLDVLMGAGESPAQVPDREIERLRAREGPDGMVRLESREFRAGEQVRLEKGAVSLDVIVDGMAGQDRVFILMQVLGAQRRAEVAVADLSR